MCAFAGGVAADASDSSGDVRAFSMCSRQHISFHIFHERGIESLILLCLDQPREHTEVTMETLCHIDDSDKENNNFSLGKIQQFFRA